MAPFSLDWAPKARTDSPGLGRVFASSRLRMRKPDPGQSSVTGCVEVSRIVGRPLCSRYGSDWDKSGATAKASALPGAQDRPRALGSYTPGTLLEATVDGSGVSRRFGCLEVRAKPTADPTTPTGSAVIEFSFGNACDDPIRIALQEARASRAMGSGCFPGREALKLCDPASEVVTLSLGGRDQAREVLEFHSPCGGERELPSVCIDVSAPLPDVEIPRMGPMGVDAPRRRLVVPLATPCKASSPFDEGGPGMQLRSDVFVGLSAGLHVHPWDLRFSTRDPRRISLRDARPHVGRRHRKRRARSGLSCVLRRPVRP